MIVLLWLGCNKYFSLANTTGFFISQAYESYLKFGQECQINGSMVNGLIAFFFHMMTEFLWILSLKSLSTLKLLIWFLRFFILALYSWQLYILIICKVSGPKPKPVLNLESKRNLNLYLFTRWQEWFLDFLIYGCWAKMVS